MGHRRITDLPWNRCGFTVVDLWAGLLILCYVVSAIYAGVPVYCMYPVIPYVALFLILSSMPSCTGKFSRITVLLLGLWGLCESVTGLLQIIGVIQSNNAFFPVTGSFLNPGPYCGFLACSSACLLPLLRDSDSKWTKWIAGVCCVSCVIILPSTLSRAGILAFAVAMTAFLLQRQDVRGWCTGHAGRLAVMVVLCILALAGLFFLKKDSALGRVHVWHMGLKAVAGQPLHGYGPFHSLGALGAAQAEYFRASLRPDFITRIAGCPEYVFNEFLRVGIETGLPGLVCSLLLALTCVRRLWAQRNPMALGAIALAFFSLFSYPMSLWQFRVIAVIYAANACPASDESGLKPVMRVPRYLLLALSVTAVILLIPRYRAYGQAEKQWQESQSPEELSPLYATLKYDYRYLYDYGYALYCSSRYEDAISILDEGSRMSSDPLFHVIPGRCHEELGRYDSAEECYRYAHEMVPCRLYPLVRLFRMYVRTGRDVEAVAVGEEIKGMMVNERNMTMKHLKDETMVSLDSLKTLGIDHVDR